MSNEAFIDSLNENHEFPCSYQLKVIGENSETFVSTILQMVCDELGLTDSPEHSLKQTPQGRHVSITLEIHAETASQVASLYSQLQAHNEVRYLM